MSSPAVPDPEIMDKRDPDFAIHQTRRKKSGPRTLDKALGRKTFGHLCQIIGLANDHPPARARNDAGFLPTAHETTD